VGSQFERKVLCHTTNTKEMLSLLDGNQILLIVGRILRTRTPRSATPCPAIRILRCLRPNLGEILRPGDAVGTTIADRPPHRSVRARLRIRLLRRMSGVEACIGIGVQNAGRRNPPVQDWGKTFPTHLCALAAADQNTLP